MRYPERQIKGKTWLGWLNYLVIRHFGGWRVIAEVEEESRLVLKWHFIRLGWEWLGQPAVVRVSQDHPFRARVAEEVSKAYRSRLN